MMSRGERSERSLWQAALVALLVVFAASTSWAQSSTASNEAAEEEDAAELNPVVVTGSRIKRTDIEGPQPIIVIDQAQMNERGYTTVYEVLSDLTINNGYKFEGAEAALFTPDVQTINLRGFGVGTTLTLINGRRLTNYPAAYQSQSTVFSYGSIPVVAIERIEILTTGASAIYGSDAIAGVVNIILRNDIDETTVNALWGTPTETNGTRDDIRLQFLNGKTFTRGSYTFTAEYIDRDAILGKHYDQYDDQMEDYPYGTGYYNRSLLTLDMFKNAFRIYPTYRDPAEIFGISGDQACAQAQNGVVYAFRPGSAGDPGNFCGDPTQGVPEVNFQNQKESLSLYFNGKYEIGDQGTELFTDILYYTSESSSNNNTVALVEDVLDLNKPDTVGFGFYDWYAVQRFFNERDVGAPLIESFDDDAYTVVGGIRGVLWDLHDYEFSVNYSKYEYKSSRPHLKWRETIDTYLGTWLGKSFFGDDWWSGGTLGEGLPFGVGIPDDLYGPAGADVLNTFGTQTYSNESDDLFFQYIMNGDLYEMRAGPLSYAFVAEYEDQSLTYIPDDLLRQAPPTTDVNGDEIIGLTGSGWYRLTGYNAKGDRQRWSLGGELRIPLHETFTVNLAARYDDYDSTSTSFGGDLTPSISAEWRPLDGLLFRAGYTESFRAPDMALVFVETGSFQSGTDFISCLEQYVLVEGTEEGFNTADCDSQFYFSQRVGGQVFGAPPLDAETGDNTWVGFSWDITDDLNITVDYTEMSLEQRTLTQNTQDLFDDEWDCYNGREPGQVPCDQIGDQVVRSVDPTTGLSFVEALYRVAYNQFEEEASFIDVQISYNLATEYGDFNFQGDYMNMLSHTRKLSAESAEVDLKNDPFAGGWDFRSSFIGSLTWSYRDFATTLTGIYRGGTTKWWGYTFTGNVTGEDYSETENWWNDSYLTWNLTAQYNWTDAFLTRLRLVNVLDEEPPYDDTFMPYEPPWYNYFVYPGAGIGRYAAIEAQYTWE